MKTVPTNTEVTFPIMQWDISVAFLLSHELGTAAQLIVYPFTVVRVACEM